MKPCLRNSQADRWRELQVAQGTGSIKDCTRSSVNGRPTQAGTRLEMAAFTAAPNPLNSSSDFSGTLGMEVGTAALAAISGPVLLIAAAPVVWKRWRDTTPSCRGSRL